MGRIYSLKSDIFYIVEERLLSDLQRANYAWLCYSNDEAERTLLEQVRLHGKDRFYTVYILVE